MTQRSTRDELPPAPRRLRQLRQYWRGWPGRLLRLLLAVVPAVWLVQRMDLGQVARLGRSTPPVSLVVASAVGVVAVMVAALRWRLLMWGLGTPRVPSYAAMLQHYLVGLYYNLLPSGAAADVVRGYRVRQAHGGLLPAYVVLVLDRVMGVMGMVGVALVARLLGPVWVSAAVELALRTVALGCGALLLLLLAVTRAGGGLHGGRWVQRHPLLQRALSALTGPHATWALLGVLGLALVEHGLNSVLVHQLMRTLVPAQPLVVTAAVMPMIQLLVSFPITPGAVGQRELLFIHLFALVGVSGEAALTVSLLAYVPSAVVVAAGALLVLRERLKDWSADPPA